MPPPMPRVLSRPLPQSPLPSRTSKPTLDRRRPISTYGYTQAKALVYAKHGEPKDVLEHLPHPPPLTTTLGTAEPTATPGNEACFEVLSTGSASTPTLRPGDWVIPTTTGLGTWRTHLQVPSTHVMRVDKTGLSANQVASVTVNPVTAYRLLRDFVRLDPDRGDWFIQNGANSGVGRMALQLGKRWGYRSIAVVRGRPGAEGEALRAELEELGATRVVTEEELLGRGFAAQVKEWTRGGRERLRLGLNCVGGKPAVGMARCLDDGGHLVTYGAMSRQPVAVPAGMLIFRGLVFEGFWVSRWGDGNAEEKRRTVGELLEVMREGG
ncbi:MAG: mitochondrial trans-2-enoyl- reductase [Lasallia pustulata]|uniref:Mitochondrial trans-2-enoyl-reductase n=1 Tax=Lasallia pustulata TaxID=136370 RepID=A0A5M8PTJ5_9LECA|nr:MAG: mitochondrial trans-2-enoyl- reductase [Lasallia pustulata]